jgi:hypothetical protein
MIRAYSTNTYMMISISTVVVKRNEKKFKTTGVPPHAHDHDVSRLDKA